MSESVKCSRPECQGKIFSRPSALRRHVKAVHEKSEPAFHCGRCQKSFSRKEYLVRHEEAHKGHGREKCCICLRSFRFDYFDKHRKSCKNRVTRIRVPTGVRKNEGPPKVRTKKYKLRWGNTSHDVEDNVLERPSAMTDASVLRTAPSLHSNQLWRERVLCEKARLAIRNADLVLFDCFAQDLENTGLTIKALDDFINEAPANSDEPRLPLLCLAALHSTPLFVESLLNLGADVNEKTSYERTAIDFAQDADCARLLIRAGADIQHATFHILKTPLYRAINDQDVARASVLLEAGARINMRSVSGRYLVPLDLAVRQGDSQMFDLLLRAAIDRRLDLPPLSKTVIRYGSMAMIEQLLEHGAAFDMSSTEAEAVFNDILKDASEPSDSVLSTDAAKKIAVLRKHLAQSTVGPNNEAALQEDMNAMPDLIEEEGLISTSLESFDVVSSHLGEQTQSTQPWTSEVFPHPPQPSPLVSSSDQGTPPASSAQLTVEDWFQFFGIQSEEALSVPAPVEQYGSSSHDFEIHNHIEPQVAPTDLAARAESQNTDLAALRQATALLKDNGLLDQAAFATLTASIDMRRRTAISTVKKESPEEMQKRDPLGTQIWKLYHKQVGQLPNSERLENLSWRMMSMNLRRREMERRE